MTKKDFVTAWLLAARVGSASWTEEMLHTYIIRAEALWDLLEKRYEEDE